MDQLPDELVLAIISHLDDRSLVRLQLVSRRLQRLARDDNVWKRLCFELSRANGAWKRQTLAASTRPQSSRSIGTAFATLRDAFDRLYSRGTSNDEALDSATPRQRVLANWDPAYGDQRVDYYQEYVHRHATIAPLGWLSVRPSSSPQEYSEALGLAVLRHAADDSARIVVAPIDDGSVCIWDLSASSTAQKPGRTLGHSQPGLLAGGIADRQQCKAIMTASNAVESVSVQRATERAFFAVADKVHQVDLNTLQLVSSRSFPSTVTALSEGDSSQELTVGATSTLHIYDPREHIFASSMDIDTVRCERLGSPNSRPAVLADSGPVSVLHLDGFGADEYSIWVAGRWKSIMVYDLRNFPRLVNSVFSGATISSMSHLPYLQKPRHFDLVTDPSLSVHDLAASKAKRGSTILATGEYKGKGSLELYGLGYSRGRYTCDVVYQNRQTASSSPVLAASPHGASIVTSDGNGVLKWFERDGFTPIRTYHLDQPSEVRAEYQPPRNSSVFSAAALEYPGQGEIVRKLLQTRTSHIRPLDSTVATRSNDLLLWTGDGRIGLLGFGHGNPVAQECFAEHAKSAEERALEEAERQYQHDLSQVLMSQANEARFMRGLGLA